MAICRPAEAAFESAAPGRQPCRVSIPLGQAYLLQGKFDTLLGESPPWDSRDDASLKCFCCAPVPWPTRANRQASLRMLEEALAVDAVGQRPSCPRDGARHPGWRFQRARAFVDEANKLAPNDAGPDHDGFIAHARGDSAGAPKPRQRHRGPK